MLTYWTIVRSIGPLSSNIKHYYNSIIWFKFYIGADQIIVRVWFLQIRTIMLSQVIHTCIFPSPTTSEQLVLQLLTDDIALPCSWRLVQLWTESPFNFNILLITLTQTWQGGAFEA